jgi:hypothetical protein
MNAGSEDASEWDNNAHLLQSSTPLLTSLLSQLRFNT